MRPETATALRMASTLRRLSVSLASFKAQPAKEAQSLRTLTGKLQTEFDSVAGRILAELGDATLDSAGAREALAAEVRGLLDGFTDAMQLESGTAAQHGRNRAVAAAQRSGNRVAFTRLPEDQIRWIKGQAADRARLTVADLQRRLLARMERLAGNPNQARLLAEYLAKQSAGLRPTADAMLAGFRNEAAFLTQAELGFQHYHLWETREDELVRDTHVAQHNQVTRLGDPFQNGLSYPGDTSGPIEEWINCRCRLVPYEIPAGMMPPVGEPYWYAGSEVPILSIREVAT